MPFLLFLASSVCPRNSKSTLRQFQDQEKLKTDLRQKRTEASTRLDNARSSLQVFWEIRFFAESTMVKLIRLAWQQNEEILKKTERELTGVETVWIQATEAALLSKM